MVFDQMKILQLHGVLNTVSWGIMMPLGFMAARYLKAVGPKVDPLWFYTHIVLQLPGFLLGMAGGATGLYLGIKYSGVHQYPSHLYIGITLLFLGTLQVYPSSFIHVHFNVCACRFSYQDLNTDMFRIIRCT